MHSNDTLFHERREPSHDQKRVAAKARRGLGARVEHDGPDERDVVVELERLAELDALGRKGDERDRRVTDRGLQLGVGGHKSLADAAGEEGR